MHSMLGLGKEDQSWYYIKYSMYTHTLNLWIKGCPLYRSFVCDATHNKSLGTGLTDSNELCKFIIVYVMI